MNDWQKMDTAPRDGSPIMLFTDHPEPTKRIEIGTYAAADPSEDDSMETWCDSGFTPSHWMPLPVAPGDIT